MIDHNYEMIKSQDSGHASSFQHVQARLKKGRIVLAISCP